MPAQNLKCSEGQGRIAESVRDDAYREFESITPPVDSARRLADRHLTGVAV